MGVFGVVISTFNSNTFFPIWQVEKENECNEDDDWEYVEEGPAEIIWQGNEIIVRKKRVRVPKKSADQQNKNEVKQHFSPASIIVVSSFIFVFLICFGCYRNFI